MNYLVGYLGVRNDQILQMLILDIMFFFFLNDWNGFVNMIVK